MVYKTLYGIKNWIEDIWWNIEYKLGLTSNPTFSIARMQSHYRDIEGE